MNRLPKEIAIKFPKVIEDLINEYAIEVDKINYMIFNLLIKNIKPTPSHFNVKSILIRMSHHIRMSHPYNTAVEHINYCPFCDGSKRIGEIKALKTGYYLLICNRKHESICVEKNEYTSLETIRAEINKFNCVKWDKW